MPAYATKDDIDQALAELGATATVPENPDPLLEAASRDVDRVLGPIRVRRVDPFAGFKLDPDDLDDTGRKALARATAAQAVHRLLNPELFTGQRIASSIKGPDFEESYSVTGDAARTRLSPAVRDELVPLRHLRPTGVRATA